MATRTIKRYISHWVLAKVFFRSLRSRSNIPGYLAAQATRFTVRSSTHCDQEFSGQSALTRPTKRPNFRRPWGFGNPAGSHSVTPGGFGVGYPSLKSRIWFSWCLMVLNPPSFPINPYNVRTYIPYFIHKEYFPFILTAKPCLACFILFDKM